jgi:protease IV
MRVFAKLLIGLLASFGFLVIMLFCVLIYIAISSDSVPSQASKPPENMVLSLNLDAGFSEGKTGRDMSYFGFQGRTSLQDAVVALRRARDDDRVKAVVANISGQSLGLAQIQDIRNAVATFRESGKPTYLYSETIGELGNATPAYYLASAFEEIWLQPSGGVGLTGLALEQPFFKEFLDRLGVRANVIQRYEYKSAAENLTNSGMSEPAREALDSLFGAIFNQIVNGVAKSRQISEDDVKQLMRDGPLLAQEALDGGLVDSLGYRDEFDDHIETDFDDAKKVSLGRYLSFGLPEDVDRADRSIAVIHAIGPIQRGESDDNPFATQAVIGSDTLASAIRSAAEDENIDAILMRIDSPGGSYVASDTVWREVVKATEAEKPFIVSMGNTAASGGYYIAMAADTIFAQPGTVTGSIGVIVNKIVLEEAFEKLDINWTTLTYGDNGAMFTATRDFNDAEMLRMNRTLDAIYNDFTSKAALGRDMPVDEIRRIARGRVWSGEDAKRIGLVDELGGLSDAIEHTKVAIGLTADDLVRLVAYPPPKAPLEALKDALEDGSLPFGLQNAIRMLVSISGTVNNWIVPYVDGPESSILFVEPIIIR